MKMLNVLKVLISCSLIFVFSLTSGFSQQSIGLTNADVTIIREAFHLQSMLGHLVWHTWNTSRGPFLYKTSSWDYLINYPNPPKDFSSLYDKSWGDTIYFRINTDTLDYQAAYPIEGIQTAVMTAPTKSENPYSWVLTTVHELFHVYQGLNCIVNPFVGQYVDKNELSFPFDYSNANVLAVCNIEAELLFNLVTKKQLESSDSIVSKRVLSNMQKLITVIFTDSLHTQYKQLMEWKEGVARYTECKLAELAQNPSIYQPTREFQLLFPESSYSQVWTDSYSNESIINPIRFVGVGVSGRVMFYYSGMAKAYVLDRILPDWHSEYFKKTLDELLTK